MSFVKKPFRRSTVRGQRRGYRRRARGRQCPGADVLARAHERRPVLGPGRDPAECGHFAGHPGCDVAGGHGGGAPSSPSGDRRLSGQWVRSGRAVPGLLQEMMGFLGRRPVEGQLAGLLFDDLQFEGGDSGEIAWGDEISASQKVATPVVVIGCGMGGILAGIRLKQAGLPFTIVDKNGGPGGTWWENRYPGTVDVGAISTASRSSRPGSGPSTTASSRSCTFTSERSSTNSTSGRTAASRPPSPRWSGRGPGHVARPPRHTSGAEEVLEARFVISAVGSFNLPRLPDLKGMDTFAGPSFHSARWPEDLDIRGTDSRSSAPAPADSRSARDRRRSRTAHDLPAHGPVDPAQPDYHTPVPAGDAWALGTCLSMDGGTGSS